MQEHLMMGNITKDANFKIKSSHEIQKDRESENQPYYF
jgi:hypothetical protein